ncbi:hypothetical protein GW17_00032503 [Ensete ventricosum]|nr:hypothetical protein GW17_00032503 [Ensete ventricosum]RZR98861.1 hypothetical protein BHM03_00028307 [Ensete ventricosum]
MTLPLMLKDQIPHPIRNGRGNRPKTVRNWMHEVRTRHLKRREGGRERGVQSCQLRGLTPPMAGDTRSRESRDGTGSLIGRPIFCDSSHGRRSNQEHADEGEMAGVGGEEEGGSVGAELLELHPDLIGGVLAESDHGAPHPQAHRAGVVQVRRRVREALRRRHRVTEVRRLHQPLRRLRAVVGKGNHLLRRLRRASSPARVGEHRHLRRRSGLPGREASAGGEGWAARRVLIYIDGGKEAKVKRRKRRNSSFYRQVEVTGWGPVPSRVVTAYGLLPEPAWVWDGADCGLAYGFFTTSVFHR